MQGTIVYAFKPGNGGPDCKHAIRIDTTMTAESNSCLTYTECDTGQSCIDGNVYNNCGPVGFVDAYCGDYTNGTWNSTTGRCEGGFLINGQYYWNGYVAVACSPNPDPHTMRVPNGPGRAEETLDETDKAYP